MYRQGYQMSEQAAPWDEFVKRGSLPKWWPEGMEGKAYEPPAVKPREKETDKEKEKLKTAAELVDELQPIADWKDPNKPDTK